MESESMSFQKIVLIVAIIALILMLSVIGYMMYYSSQNQPYPPIGAASQCPDEWRDIGATCTNDITSSNKTNVGNYIMDYGKCVIGATSGTQCNNGATAGYRSAVECVGDTWVKGNVTNGLDDEYCYLLAKGYAGSGVTLTYHKETLEKDVDWAKKYGITWDGYN